MDSETVSKGGISLDLGDRFRQSCEFSSSYPCNLIQSRYPRYALAHFGERLRAESDRLFDDEQCLIEFLEIFSGDTGEYWLRLLLASLIPCPVPPLQSAIHDEGDLIKHVQQNRKDPRFRYM
jgi:hypothetical protein